MRVLLLIVLGIAALAGPAAAQEGQERGMLLRTDRSAALLEAGRRSLFSFRVDEAERTFRRLAAEPDGAVAAYHHLALAVLARGLMTGDAAAFDAFFARSDSLFALLDRTPASPWRDYLRAEAHLQRAMALAKTERFVKAALAARSAYGGFERLVRDHPSFYEPYKGLGLLHLSIGSLPRGYRGLLRVLGYGGSIRGGLAMLEQAAAHSRFNREEALVFTALTRSILYRTEAGSVDVLGRLHREYPDSPFFAHLYGFALLSNRQAADAEAVLRLASEKSDDPAYVPVHYADFYLAEALFKQGRYAEAEARYRRYLVRHDGPALRASASLGLGLALELQDRRAEALPFYRQVASKRGFDTDDAALRTARRRLEAPLAGRERSLLLGRMAFDAGRHDAAVALLASVRDDPQASADERAEAYYRLGRVYHAAGRHDEALRWYRAAVDNPGEAGSGAAPWSQYYIGEILAGRGARDEAADAFRRARAYRGAFEYAQALDQHVRVALEQLDAGS